MSQMHRSEIDYHLVDLGWNEWRFQESEFMHFVTERFDQIRELASGKRYATELKRLIKDYPGHIDALHHYGLVQSQKGNNLEAFAFAHAAVGVGKRCFPKEFLENNGRLPGGFVTNRPFLRSMHGLMSAQASLCDFRAAIHTGDELMKFDRDDRMGARLDLPLYHIAIGDYGSALAIFELRGFEDTFGCAVFLKALAQFKLNKVSECRNTIDRALSYHPHVARYILNRDEHQPPNDSMPGCITWGSPFEGWFFAQQYGPYWRLNEDALKFLEVRVANVLGKSWVKYNPRLSSQ